MTTPYAGYSQSLAYSAAKDRRIISTPMAGAVATPSDGVVLGSGSTGNFSVSISSGMTLDIGGGRAIVSGYSFISPAAVQRTVAAATGAARRDLVILRVYDTESGDASSKADIEIVKGTTTSDPAIPQNSMIICQIAVPASGTAIVLTDRRKYTAAAGGVVPMTSAQPVTYDQVAPGTHVHSLTTGNSWQRSGNALVPLLGQTASLFFERTTSDATGSSTWGVLTGGSAVMPAGTYIVIGTAVWLPGIDPNAIGYSWLEFTFNGAEFGKTQPYAGVKTGNSGNQTSQVGLRSHPGGTMSLMIRYGFSGYDIWGMPGSSILAVRVGP